MIFTNCFGVCWGVRTIIGHDYRNGPTYFYAGSDAPWFSSAEEHFRLADKNDLHMQATASEEARWTYFQDKYGFTPSDYGGCW